MHVIHTQWIYVQNHNHLRDYVNRLFSLVVGARGSVLG
jgi:hypothetical protein